MIDEIENGNVAVVISKDAYVKLRINLPQKNFWTREKHSTHRDAVLFSCSKTAI